MTPSRAFPPPGDPANFVFTDRAYPNQLNNIGIKGNFAFVPNTGASPNGPFRFDVNTHSLLSVLDRTTNVDAGKTINMHTAVRDQTNSAKLSSPCRGRSRSRMPPTTATWSAPRATLWSSLQIAADGSAAVQSDVSDPTRVLEIPTGKNPRGIVVNADRHPRLRDELCLARCYGHQPDDFPGKCARRVIALGGVAGPGFAGRQDPRRQGALQHVDRRVRPSARQHDADRGPHVEQRVGRLHRVSHAIRYERQRGLDFPLGSQAHDSPAHRFRSDGSDAHQYADPELARPSATKRKTSS